MKEKALNGAFYVGDWRVEPRLNRVIKEGHTVQLEPKVMEVLVVLAQHPGAVVAKGELIEAVWEGTIVVDAVLARCVSELRKTLGDDALNPTHVETIRKVGYRLIAPVREAPSREGRQVRESWRPRFWSMRWVVRWALGLLSAVGVMLVLSLIREGGWREEGEAVGYEEPIPLTSYQGSEVKPALSADGRQVAFSWKGASKDNWDVYIKSLDAATPVRFTSDPAVDISPAWSPDGRHLAFVRLEGDTSCAIYIKPVQGQAASRLMRCGLGTFSHLDWSPDGQWLALDVIEAEGEQVRIVLFSPTTLSRRPLTSPPEAYLGDLDPRFSPDGQAVAFTRVTPDGVRDLYLTSVAGGPARQLTYDGWHIDGFDWEQDGKGLLFSSDRGGRYGLWRISVAGGEPERVRVMDGPIHRPTMALHQPRLVYERLSTDTNIWLRSLKDSAHPPTVLTPSTQWEAEPDFSPDNEQVVFTSNRSGQYQLWQASRSGGQAVQLTHFEGAYVGTPRWSSDGRTIAFVVREDGNADLFTIPAQGGIPRRITSGPEDDLYPAWSPDGKWLYFSSNRGGTWAIWRTALDGMEADQIMVVGGLDAQVSPDGAMLYYAKQDEPGLWRKALKGEGETLVIAETATPLWNSWRMTDQGIYFFQQHVPLPSLAFYVFDTETVSEVLTLDATLPRPYPSFSVSADGEWLLYAQVDQYHKDLMLLEARR